MHLGTEISAKTNYHIKIITTFARDKIKNHFHTNKYNIIMKTSTLFYTIAVILVSLFYTSPLSAKTKMQQAVSQQKALSWFDFTGYSWGLISYGLYQDGRCVNEFIPSKANGNEGEFIMTTDLGGDALTWYNTQEGTMHYTYKISKDFLYLYDKNGAEVSWMRLMGCKKERIDGEEYYQIFTVDKYNTYRYFLVDNTSLDEYLFGF